MRLLKERDGIPAGSVGVIVGVIFGVSRHGLSPEVAVRFVSKSLIAKADEVELVKSGEAPQWNVGDRVRLLVAREGIAVGTVGVVVFSLTPPLAGPDVQITVNCGEQTVVVSEAEVELVEAG